jgi:hypothetical protein
MRLGMDPPRDSKVRMSFAQYPGTAADWWDADRVTIDVLPDVALLEIFDCYVDQVRDEDDDYLEIDAWHTLVHVCQKWRFVVFGSPLRLDLRLLCTEETPVREMLAVWPSLPIVTIVEWQFDIRRIDNIIAALEHNDRVCKISLLDVTSSYLEKVLAPMRQPYLALADLSIWLRDDDGAAPIVPEPFLGGSAPRLRRLSLSHIPFPGLPKLLSSATDLVALRLRNIPNSGYFTPERIVTCLSTSTSLELVELGFKSPLSRPKKKSRRPPPLTRSIFPALTRFHFDGVSEYLEDLVARIDTPLLDSLEITFFHQLIFDTPQLTQFIHRTPNFKTRGEAHVVFFQDSVRVILPATFPKGLELQISCRQSDWQLSSLTQIYRSVLPQALIHMTERVYIRGNFLSPHWQNDIEDNQWLEVLHPFTNVKDLHVSRELTPCIAPALQELVEERVIEVLPALQSLFLGELHTSGPVQEAIGKFTAARELTDHPITVSHWDGRNVGAGEITPP